MKNFWGSELFEIRDGVLYTHATISSRNSSTHFNLKALHKEIRSPRRFGPVEAAMSWITSGLATGTIVEYTEEEMFLALL